MTGTMTWVGLDVHARSTHAAAINVAEAGRVADQPAASSRGDATTFPGGDQQPSSVVT